MAHEPNEFRTKSGKVLADADFEALADEAERGYEIEEFRPVTPERAAKLREHVAQLRSSSTSE